MSFVRIAFYAPLKSPSHPVPSGDRHMARLLMRALGLAGHDVDLACSLRSWHGVGDPNRQARMAALGSRLAAGLLRRYHGRAQRPPPDLWFTYHLYYKAPDWIGPQVARSLAIPYVAAEASVAHKRAGGPWDRGHRAVLEALTDAASVIALNPADIASLPDPNRVCRLRPFIDERPFVAAREVRTEHRQALAARCGLDPSIAWIAVVAMMRSGDKLASYRVVSQVMQRLIDRPWRLLVIGDGPAQDEIGRLLRTATDGREVMLGRQSPEDLPGLLAACDLLFWPAVNEAYGMALLEGQAAGLPVVAGRSGGVPDVLEDGVTAFLSDPLDAERQSDAVAALLDDCRRRERMGRAAQERVAALHSLGNGAAQLDRIVTHAAGLA